MVKLEDATYDIMVIDEAWQMGWSDFMLCWQVSGRFVLIGDPGQIPPIVSIKVQRWETSPRAPHQPAPELILADERHHEHDVRAACLPATAARLGGSGSALLRLRVRCLGSAGRAVGQAREGQRAASRG